MLDCSLFAGKHMITDRKKKGFISFNIVGKFVNETDLSFFKVFIIFLIFVIEKLDNAAFCKIIKMRKKWSSSRRKKEVEMKTA